MTPWVWFLALAYAAIHAVVGLWFAYLALILAAAAWGRVRGGRGFDPGGPVSGGDAPRFAFVIPAHDEEANVAETVASCRAAVSAYGSPGSVFVIADNCSDATARVAREAGAFVVERSDPVLRSKGHALAWFFDGGWLSGRDPSAGGPFDAAVVVDADSAVDAGLLNGFARALGGGYDWAQCFDTVRNPEDSWRTRLMVLGFSLINGVWLLGQSRLGLSAALRGNGMCFSAKGLKRVPWRSHGLTEDIEYSWSLRVAGERVAFVPGVRVLAEMPAGGSAAASQRRRWESGRKALRGAYLGPVLRSPQLKLRARVLYAAELLFPTLTGLKLGLVAATSLQATALIDPGLRGLARALLVPEIVMWGVLAAYAVSPVVLLGVPARYLLALGAFPYYAAWKLVRAAGRPTQWVRTARGPAPSRPTASEGAAR